MNDVISEGGERLRVFLDGTHVESRWIADYHVIWQTGQSNGPAEGDPAHHTHCSAYVAAVALYLDIYILRPPDHKQLRLANAQISWLRGDGTENDPTAVEAGWSPLGMSGDNGVLDNAITAANAGELVAAGYFQPPTEQSRYGSRIEVGFTLIHGYRRQFRRACNSLLLFRFMLPG
jgi:hypothetical protein